MIKKIKVAILRFNSKGGLLYLSEMARKRIFEVAHANDNISTQSYRSVAQLFIVTRPAKSGLSRVAVLTRPYPVRSELEKA